MEIGDRPESGTILGRPREFDETEALTGIMEAFWTGGFEGTSMAHLTAATGLKKGSLYAAFGDKRSLYRKALAHYDRTRIDAKLAELMGPGPARERIAAFLEAPGTAPARGCFLCKAASDQGRLDPKSAALVTASLERLEAGLRAVLDELALRPKPARRLARHLLTTYLGLNVLADAGAESKIQRDSRRQAISLLPGD